MAPPVRFRAVAHVTIPYPAADVGAHALPEVVPRQELVCTGPARVSCGRDVVAESD